MSRPAKFQNVGSDTHRNTQCLCSWDHFLDAGKAGSMQPDAERRKTTDRAKSAQNQKRSASPQSAQKAALPQNCLTTPAIVRSVESLVNTPSVTLK